MNLDRRREDGDFVTLRPSSFDTFVGQSEVVANLRVMIEAAKLRGDALEHVLFSGPPGLGKTTLSHLVATGMDTTLVASSGPLLERTGDLVAILSNLMDGQVLFLDEIHRLPRPVEEILYSAMEDYKVDIVTGSGPGARTITLPLARFTLVGATTRTGLLSAPLRDRFGGLFHLEFYSAEELAEIIRRAAEALQVSVDSPARLFLAAHSRGTPRVALRLLRRMRDFAQVQDESVITELVVTGALKQLSIGPLGLDKMDRAILESIVLRFGGGPVGLDTLAAVFHEERDVLAEVHEPFLLKMGLLQKTARGRIVTAGGYVYLGMEPPKDLPAAPLFEE